MNIPKLLRINNTSRILQTATIGIRSFHTPSFSRILNQYKTPLCQLSIPKQYTTTLKTKSYNNNNIVQYLTKGRRNMSTNSVTSPSSSPEVTKPIVAHWLYFNAGLVFSIVIVGGLTRLTESGLSITEWNVIAGMKPPRSQLEWEEEFEKYKQFPEYKL